MARRSFMKMYKVLDNVEGVQGSPSGYGFGPLHNSYMKIPTVENSENGDKSKADVNKRNYDSDSNTQKSNSQQTPLRAESYPHMTPKACLRHKDKSKAPHWSNNFQAEMLGEEKKADRNSYEKLQSKASLRVRKSPRVKLGPKIENGPYTPPRFFGTPEKYLERAKKDFLYSIESKLPPSQQTWAARINKQDQFKRESNAFNQVELEKESYMKALKESKRKESIIKKPKVTTEKIEPINKHEVKKSLVHERKLKTRAVKHNRIQETDCWGSIKSNKKLQEKIKNKEIRTESFDSIQSYKYTLPMSSAQIYTQDENASKLTYGSDAWRGGKKVKKSAEISPQVDKYKYGNDAWKTTIIPPPRKGSSVKAPNTPKERDCPVKTDNVASKRKTANVSAIVGSKYKTDLMEWDARDFIERSKQDSQISGEDNGPWNSIEPNLPSFLLTHSAPSSIQVAKKEAPENVSQEPKSAEVTETPYNEDGSPLVDSNENSKTGKVPLVKAKEENICLFKYFQTRSKFLRKQHGQMEKNRKASFGKVKSRQLSGARGITYYTAGQPLGDSPTRSFINAKQGQNEREPTNVSKFVQGPFCDIADDGFKTGQFNEKFSMSQTGEKYYNFSNIFKK